MFKPLPKLKSLPGRQQPATSKVEARQSEALFFPYAQCTCDLADHSFFPPEWFEDLYHDNGQTSSHIQDCHQLGTFLPQTTRKGKSPGGLASYPLPEKEREKSKVDMRKGTARRQRKEAQRIRDAEARTEAGKAVKPTLNPYAQCHCDLFSDSDEDVVRMRHTHTDGSISFHLPNCLTGRFDYTTLHKPHISPPKSASYIDLEEKEKNKKVRNNLKHPRDQPKSAAYIDSEEEEEEEKEEEKGEDGRASPPAKRYESRTIGSDFLRVIGEHPYLPPLNAHVEGFPPKMKGRASK